MIFIIFIYFLFFIIFEYLCRFIGPPGLLPDLPEFFHVLVKK
jgi:hypothetical protein